MISCAEIIIKSLSSINYSISLIRVSYIKKTVMEVRLTLKFFISRTSVTENCSLFPSFCAASKQISCLNLKYTEEHVRACGLWY